MGALRYTLNKKEEKKEERELTEEQKQALRDYLVPGERWGPEEEEEKD